MLRVAVLIASLLAADATVAAAQTPTRIRGTIESATEQALTIYNHYKGKQWWRACDNKWIVRGRGPGQVKGDWGSMDIITKIPASEELDRTCAEKGQV
jgi:hypothetical protein